MSSLTAKKNKQTKNNPIKINKVASVSSKHKRTVSNTETKSINLEKILEKPVSNQNHSKTSINPEDLYIVSLNSPNKSVVNLSLRRTEFVTKTLNSIDSNLTFIKNNKNPSRNCTMTFNEIVYTNIKKSMNLIEEIKANLENLSKPPKILKSKISFVKGKLKFYQSVPKNDQIDCIKRISSEHEERINSINDLFAYIKNSIHDVNSTLTHWDNCIYTFLIT